MFFWRMPLKNIISTVTCPSFFRSLFTVRSFPHKKNMSDRIAIYKYVDIVREHWLKDDLHLSESTIKEAIKWLLALNSKRFQKIIWKQELNDNGVNDTILDPFRCNSLTFKTILLGSMQSNNRFKTNWIQL